MATTLDTTTVLLRADASLITHPEGNLASAKKKRELAEWKHARQELANIFKEKVQPFMLTHRTNIPKQQDMHKQQAKLEVAWWWGSCSQDFVLCGGSTTDPNTKLKRGCKTHDTSTCLNVRAGTMNDASCCGVDLIQKNSMVDSIDTSNRKPCSERTLQ